MPFWSTGAYLGILSAASFFCTCLAAPDWPQEHAKSTPGNFMCQLRTMHPHMQARLLHGLICFDNSQSGSSHGTGAMAKERSCRRTLETFGNCHPTELNVQHLLRPSRNCFAFCSMKPRSSNYSLTPLHYCTARPCMETPIERAST